MSKSNNTNLTDLKEILKLQSDLAKKSISTLSSFNYKPATVTDTEKYFVGLLYRHATILGDILRIMDSNHPRNWTSIFILFRSLTDDFLSASKVFMVKNSNEEVIRISAEAYHHMFEGMKEGAFVNQKYFNNKANGLPTGKSLAKDFNKFRNDPKNKKYFETVNKFKRSRSSTNFFRLKESEIANSGEYKRSRKSNANAFWNFKILSGTVHYSNWSYDFEERQANYPNECLKLIRELGLFAYKTILMCHLALFHERLDMLDELNELRESIRNKYKQLGIIQL